MKFLTLCLGLLCLPGSGARATDLTDPAAVLLRCRKAYSACVSYRAKGKLHSVSGVSQRAQEKEVNLLFSRPEHLFRFDWTNVVAGQANTAQSIFTRGGETYFFWGELATCNHQDDLASALDAENGPSAGLTSFLPELLRGDAGSLELVKPTLSAGALVNGAPCYLVFGITHGSDTMEVAIEKEDFAIRRVTQHYTVAAIARTPPSSRPAKANPKGNLKEAGRPAQEAPSPDFSVDEVTDYTESAFGATVTAADCDYPVPAGIRLTNQ